MRLDIYRRAENDGKFSYLAVPADNTIPEEAVNTDWQVEQRALSIDDDATCLDDYLIGHLKEQITEKGYAMTAVQ